LPLAFYQRRLPAVLQALPQIGVSALGLLIEVLPADPESGQVVSPNSYSVMSVNQDHIMQHVINKTQASILARAPFTEAYADSILPRGILERHAHDGASIEIGGTTVITICRNQDTMSDNSTIAEIGAANLTIKGICWLHLFMADIGLLFDGPVPVAKDNAATRIIAHADKTTKNVRHVSIQTLNLQHAVRNLIVYFRQVETAKNCFDHFTKALPLATHQAHRCTMMGLRFITAEHAKLVVALKLKGQASKG
jgi:hypothetical protein